MSLYKDGKWREIRPVPENIREFAYLYLMALYDPFD
jgi:hypothetical protein